jgi:hypothetical protein
VANWTFVINTATPGAIIEGKFTLKFFDMYGEDFLTMPIAFNSSCAEITHAIESLPNALARKGSVRCLMFPEYNLIPAENEPIGASVSSRYGLKFTLVLPLMYGAVKQPIISPYYHQIRPTLYSDEPTSTLATQVYPNGFTPESEEFFTLCRGVDLTIAKDSISNYFSGLTHIEMRLLQKCLGDANGAPGTKDDADYTGYVFGEPYIWDYGDNNFPHLIRIADATTNHTTDICRGSFNSVRDSGRVQCSFSGAAPGFYAMTYYDPNANTGAGAFRLFTRGGNEFGSETVFHVFSTEGILHKVSDFAQVMTASGKNAYSRVIYTKQKGNSIIGYDGDVACENSDPSSGKTRDCVNKGDYLMFMDPSMTAAAYETNSIYPNLYRVDKIDIATTSEVSRGEALYRSRITLNYGYTNEHTTDESNTLVYKFRPPANPYKIVSECSGRGECDDYDGLCFCHDGYAGQSCGKQHYLNKHWDLDGVREIDFVIDGTGGGGGGGSVAAGLADNLGNAAALGISF